MISDPQDATRRGGVTNLRTLVHELHGCFRDQRGHQRDEGQLRAILTCRRACACLRVDLKILVPDRSPELAPGRQRAMQARDVLLSHEILNHPSTLRIVQTVDHKIGTEEEDGVIVLGELVCDHFEWRPPRHQHHLAEGEGLVLADVMDCVKLRECVFLLDAIMVDDRHLAVGDVSQEWNDVRAERAEADDDYLSHDVLLSFSLLFLSLTLLHKIKILSSQP
jgi:hypothetical protein